MTTETITTESGITATVVSRTLRTELIEAAYWDAIRRNEPALLAYESAMLVAFATLPKEATPTDNGQPGAGLTPEYISMRAQAAGMAELKNQYGSRLAKVANAMVPVVARLKAVNGAPFSLNGTGQMTDKDLATALDTWIDEDFFNEFWRPLLDAINRMDAPITPLEQKPPETLTDAEREDPLSEPAADGTKPRSKRA